MHHCILTIVACLQIALLEADLAVHQQMWASQEAVLGEAAKKAALRSAAAQMPPPSSSSSSSPSPSPSPPPDDILYRRNASEFGYDALLAHWRKQTHKCMVQQLLREKDVKAMQSEMSTMRYARRVENLLCGRRLLIGVLVCLIV